eukprot:TRINITY_DN678_c0_g1_i2.p1 TRINITY_DN678_c0_g1~~TRINITY_DN678_c0_g1_i2.p1  ORF type:complete len:457 (-),score=116.02 TRINITY_DN678_c0_g1_i2:580-1950(-)
MRGVDAETRQYFSQLNKTLQEEGLENEEENEMFVSNVLDQLKGRELQLCTDKRCSPVIEQILFRANHDQMVQFLSSLEENPTEPEEENGINENSWIQLFFHCNGCHIIQSIIERIPFLLNSSQQKKKKSKLESILLNLCNQLFKSSINQDNSNEKKEEEEDQETMSNIDQLFSSILYSCSTDRYASHVLKSLMLTLRGISVPSKKGGKHKPIDIAVSELPRQDVPASFGKMLKSILDSLKVFDLNNFVFDNFANPVTQIAIDVSPSPEDQEQLINKAFCFDSNDPSVYDPQIQYILSDILAMHFLEKVFRSGTTEMWMRLYNNYLKKKMSFYAVHPVANFAVRACIDGASTDSELKMLADELFPLFGDIFDKKKFGILQSLTEACARLQTKQKDIIRSFTKLAKGEDIAKFLLYLKSEKVSPFGSQILQSIFKFNSDARQSTLERCQSVYLPLFSD